MHEEDSWGTQGGPARSFLIVLCVKPKQRKSERRQMFWLFSLQGSTFFSDLGREQLFIGNQVLTVPISFWFF